VKENIVQEQRLHDKFCISDPKVVSANLLILRDAVIVC